MRVPLHIVQARRERLREFIRREGFVPVAQICKHLGISEATARRDLADIERDGHISRTLGGALADYNASFASLNEREKKARPAKELIARVALRSVPLAGVVYLDAGTTVLAIARLIARRKNTDLTIVTNSLAVGTVLGGATGVALHLIGGEFLHRQAVLFGEAAVKAVAQWRFDLAFMGSEAMDAAGIWNSHAEVARLQQMVLRRTPRAVFCLDATKIGRTTPHLAATWKQVSSLITDASPRALADAGIVASAVQQARSPSSGRGASARLA